MEKINHIRKVLEEKFENYFLGMYKFKDEYTFVFDDKDSKYLSKDELKEKVHKFVEKELGDSKHKFKVIFLLEIWQMCFDAKYDVLMEIAAGEIIHDHNDVLGAMKLTEVHKHMTLQKFEKYIVAYVGMGAIFRGDANPNSDIDAFIVIDDTDVKRMTRIELRDKLMAIIYQMAAIATQQTGIKRKLHVQTYLLTDFWDTLKDSASPVIFTFLRDGIPFFDRGIYMPWRQLLNMGKIRPSPEAIKVFNDSGSQFFDRAKKKLSETCVEDCYYAILNPAQAALMMHGVAPTTPRETVKMFRETFVEKEKSIEPEYADILQRAVENWKKYEYGELKNYDPYAVGKLFDEVDKFLKRLEKLFGHIDTYMEKESVLELYDKMMFHFKILFDDNIPEDLVQGLKDKYGKSGQVSEAILKKIKLVLETKEKHDDGTITSAQVQKLRKEFTSLDKFLEEFVYMQKQAEPDTVKFKVVTKDGVKNIALLDAVYIFEENKILKLEHGKSEEIAPEAIEAAIASKKRLKLSAHVIKDLEKVFGEGIEIMI